MTGQSAFLGVIPMLVTGSCRVRIMVVLRGDLGEKSCLRARGQGVCTMEAAKPFCVSENKQIIREFWIPGCIVLHAGWNRKSVFPRAYPGPAKPIGMRYPVSLGSLGLPVSSFQNQPSVSAQPPSPTCPVKVKKHMPAPCSVLTSWKYPVDEGGIGGRQFRYFDRHDIVLRFAGNTGPLSSQ